MKIGEHVNQGLRDAFQKNWPLVKWLSVGGTIYRMRKKIVLRSNGVFNIQREAKKSKIGPECLILI